MTPPLEIRPLRADESDRAASLLTHLNPDCPAATLRDRLHRILNDHPHYHPFGGFRDDRLLVFAGAWIATKVWCGRYLEIDNFVVHPSHRSRGHGGQMMAHLEAFARERGCQLVTLDSYTQNHPSHRLYHRCGYEIWGFHFVKPLADFEH